MNIARETKEKLACMFLAGLEGRNPRHYILDLDGDECLAGHSLLQRLDGLLRSQWMLMSSPEPEPEEAP